uniref:Uncharacterized protein n=1 Tax=Zea mays TaxID=4577 RepID=B6TLX3_MAIZE|nr:hypothetical protein [Zea mays]
MAVFSDLHTADGLKSLEAHLAGKTYVSGDSITKDDIKVFAAVPSKDLRPWAVVCVWVHVCAWRRRGFGFFSGFGRRFDV